MPARELNVSCFTDCRAWDRQSHVFVVCLLLAIAGLWKSCEGCGSSSTLCWTYRMHDRAKITEDNEPSLALFAALGYKMERRVPVFSEVHLLLDVSVGSPAAAELAAVPLRLGSYEAGDWAHMRALPV
jgi:hypothetical protein